MDGDGIETIGLAGGPGGASVYFDHDGDGVKSATGWLKGDDGWLVLDRNGNGVIDSGKELFGEDTPNNTAGDLSGQGTTSSGFAALRNEDTNGDGVVDVNDARWSQLRVWRDLNQDGVSQPGELFSLASLGITSIGVGNTTANQNLGNGNQLLAAGSFTRSDGTTGLAGTVGQVGDLNLGVDTFHRTFSDTVAVADDVAALPDVQGSGTVRDLREAASLDTDAGHALRTLLAQYASATTRTAQDALIDQLLAAWAATSDHDKTLQQRAGDGYDVYFQSFGAVRASDHATSTGPDGLYSSLIAQWNANVTTLETFNGRYFFELPSESQPGGGAVIGLSVAAASGGGEGGAAVAPKPSILINYDQRQLDLLQQSYDALKQSVYDSLLLQTRFKPVLDSIGVNIDASGVTLDFSAVDVFFTSDFATDPVNAVADLFEFNRASRSMLTDTTWDGDALFSAQVGRLTVTPAIQAVFDEFGIKVAAAGGQELFGQTGTTIDYLIGLSGNDLLHGGAGNDLLDGQDGNDVLFGDDGNDIIRGGSGDDELHGGNDDDLLIGGDGTDRLFGEDGNDTLIGGAGDDVLTGGRGNNTYRFSNGDGHDTIQQLYDPTPGKLNTIEFDASVDPATVTIQKVLENQYVGGYSALEIHYGTGDDKITVIGFASFDDPYYPNNPLQRITFADGTSWDLATLISKTEAGTDQDDVLVGTTGAETIHGGLGNDSISGRQGDDVLFGEEGDDRLYGEDGNDQLDGGAGNDLLDGGSGNDVLTGGTGDDVLFGGQGSNTYRFSVGDGHDTIQQAYDPTPGKLNTIAFDASVDPATVTIQKVLENQFVGGYSALEIHYGTGDDKITVIGFASFDDPYYPNNPLQRITFADGTSWDLATLISKTEAGTDQDDVLVGTTGAETIHGGLGNDSISGRQGDDVLFGEEGDDRLYGEDGNDQLDGGAGNDLLDGGSGNDVLTGGTGDDVLFGGQGSNTYRFSVGDGHDTIQQAYDPTPGKLNTIAFDASVDPATVTIQKVLENQFVGGYSALEIHYGTGDDKITVIGFASFDDPYYPNNPLQRITFADGTSWDLATLISKTEAGTDQDDVLVGTTGAETIHGGLGNDSISGRQGDDVLFGEEGDDRLYGEDGNDQLDGGAGNDLLDGGSGNDVLTGGTGDDVLFGGQGSNTYRFSVGDGHDTIQQAYDPTPGKLNTIAFDASVDPATVTIQKVLENQFVGGYSALEIHYGTGDDKITVIGFASFDDPYYPNNPLQRITFADGTSWDLATLISKTEAGTDQDDVLVGTTGAETIHGGLGNDSISGRQGDDVLFGEEGDDRLYGEDGNDQLDGGAGNDLLDGGSGNDVLTGGTGDDVLFGGQGSNTYRFSVGDGHDTIQQAYDPTPGKLNTIAFDASVDPATVTIQKVLENQFVGGYSALEIHYGTGDDKITVIGFASFDDPYYPNNPLQRITFADGTSWDLATLISKTEAGTDQDDVLVGTTGAETIHGGLGNDSISGRQGDDVLFGEEGDDRLYGEDGNDQLDGGADNDLLDGGSGNDVLTGGTGDDVLFGGQGSNTYRFSVGDGHDTIQQAYDPTPGKLNTIAFDASVDPATVTIQKVLENQFVGGYSALEIHYGTGDDKITVIGFASFDDPYYPNNPLQRITFADGTSWDLATLISKTEAGTDQDDVLVGTTGAETIHGGLGNDSISARQGDDILFGEAGDDQLYGEDGNDQLDGGAGNDRLDGGEGDDTLTGGTGDDFLAGGRGSNTYRFAVGDGHDTIQYAYDGTHGKLNTIVFDASVDPSTVTVQKVIDNQFIGGYSALEIHYGSGDDQIKVLGFAAFDDPNYPYNPLQQITFADGTTWDLATLISKTEAGTDQDDVLVGTTVAETIYGGLGNDTISARQGDDILFGEAGDDQLYGEDGYDQLDGGAGNDRLDGGEGDDTLIGGTGDDVLSGGRGSNTYQFSVGDGHDTIQYAYDGTPGKLNTIVFDASVDPSTVTFQLALDNQNFGGNTSLRIGYGNSDDSIVVQGFSVNSDALSPYNPLQQISFSNGTVLGIADIVSALNASNGGGGQIGGGGTVGTAGDDVLTGSASVVDLLQGLGGNDVLNALGSGDTLDGGDGDDVLNADRYQGGTTFIGGKGNDTIVGSYYDDHYLFNLGDGQDVISDNGPGYINDTLTFGAGIAPSDVTAKRVGSDLILTVGSSGDQITVKVWFDADSNQIENINFADGTTWTKQQITTSALEVFGTDGDDTLTGVAAFADVLHGGAGNDTLQAIGSGDTLDGGDGDDVLNAERYQGGTTFIGGKGNDTIVGSYYDDHYLFNLGDGQDVISDNGPGYINDTLTFGAGIAPSDVTAKRVGSDLILTVGSSGDQITVKVWFDADSNQIENINFADGTTWTKQQITTSALEVFGTDGDDTLTGVAAFADVLHGGAGNDTLQAIGSGDTLDGGDGDDVLNAERYQGGTTFIGGKGNDTIVGSYYDDHYLFNLGDGQDVISDNGPGYFNDTLTFGAGIAPSDVTAKRVGSDLILTVGSSGDQITVKVWFDADSNQIENINFADGTTWTKQQITTSALEVFGTDGDDTLTGVAAFADVLHGGAGNDTLQAIGSGDTLDGGDGDDVLNADFYWSGTTFVGGKGNDTLNGSYFSDNYQFNLGDGQDVIQENGPTYFADTLTFGAGINPSDVTFSRIGLDAFFKIGSDGDQIKVNTWFGGDGQQIEQVNFADGTTWSRAQLNATALEVFGTAGDDTLSGVNAYVDVLHGGAGNDTLNASGSGDTLDGGDGNDVLNADFYWSGTTFVGGKGNDVLNGSYFSDNYQFNLGDGQDVIQENGPTYFADTLTFGAGIDPGDVSFSRVGLDAFFKIGSDGDQIKANTWFGGDGQQIEQVNFADGTTWSRAQLNATALEVFGTNGNDTLTGVSAYVDVLHGGAGNDTLNASGSGDTIDGGDGDDVLNADFYQGETTFIGGKGNDTLNGSYFADHYQFTRGDGQDTITENGPGYYTDTLTFGSGISTDQLWFEHTDNDLKIDVIGTSDSVTVANWFGSDWAHLEQIKLSDGEVLLDSAVNALVNAMAAFAPPSAGQTTLPDSYQQDLLPVIASSWHAP